MNDHDVHPRVLPPVTCSASANGPLGRSATLAVYSEGTVSWRSASAVASCSVDDLMKRAGLLMSAVERKYTGMDRDAQRTGTGCERSPYAAIAARAGDGEPITDEGAT
jgi:hypothetical protein